jgi:UTP-glucose-1-phosphate uridylyltransferase
VRLLITDALMTLAKQGKVIAYKFEGIRYDCGSVKSLVKATNALTFIKIRRRISSYQCKINCDYLTLYGDVIS